MQIYLNYALLVQFTLLAGGWFLQGDKMQALYWVGAFICTSGVTFK